MVKNKKTTEEISAVVLRFRDKGEGNSDTIDEHCKIIRDKGYVWWGWWAKNYEKPPYDYFQQIERQIALLAPQGIGFPIFLLHTKKQEIYKANCSAISYENSVEGFAQTPDPDATPSYYNKSSAKLWLKFTSIEKCNPGDVLFANKYSFLHDSKSFFSGPRKFVNNHLIASFAGCKVAQIEEFLVQKRTIWFLRNQESGDKTTRVDEWLPLPGNFTQHHTRVNIGAYKLLVLSDLHFTSDKKQHQFALEQDKTSSRITLLESIMKIINSSDVGGPNQIAGVLIAGDFVFKPCDDEFNLARNFIKALLNELGLKSDQLAIVPGNHDIAYTKAEDDNGIEGESDGTDDNSLPPEASEEAKLAYRKFYEAIYDATPNKYLCGCKRILLPNHLPIEIICVNSCVLQQEKDSFVQGYVGEYQWDEIKNQLNIQPDIQTYAYRILLIHHHLSSTSIYEQPLAKNRNYNILLDAGSVSRKIRRYNIKLVIHGHGHENSSDHSAPREIWTPNGSIIPNPYDIISMGSAGSADLPGDEGNTLGILDFSKFGCVQFQRYKLLLSRRGIDSEESKPYESWTMPIY